MMATVKKSSYMSPYSQKAPIKKDGLILPGQSNTK